MRWIGSTADTTSSSDNSPGDFTSAMPPPTPRCDRNTPACTSCCNTFARYAGGTRVAVAICSVVCACGALAARCIPARSFLMGLPDEDILAEEHEKPQRFLWLASYWIDIFPVTNARFGLFLAAGGYDEPRWWAPAGWKWRARCGIRQPLLWGEAGW